MKSKKGRQQFRKNGVHPSKILATFMAWRATEFGICCRHLTAEQQCIHRYYLPLLLVWIQWRRQHSLLGGLSQSWGTHGELQGGCSSCSMINTFVTDAVLIERAVSC